MNQTQDFPPNVASSQVDLSSRSLPIELPPLSTPPQIKQQALAQAPIKHPHGAVFIHAQKVAALSSDLGAASERLRKMGIHIQRVEEQEKAIEEWRLQLESLYKKLGYTEKIMFTGD